MADIHQTFLRTLEDILEITKDEVVLKKVNQLIKFMSDVQIELIQ